MNHYYLSSPCSAGKTYAIIRQIENIARIGERVILCQPSKELIAETVEQFVQLAPEVYVKAIYGDPDRNISNKHCKVMKQIRDYLKSPHYDGHVLIITWSAFLRLSFIPNKHTWHFIKDEIPQAMTSFEISFADNHDIITNYLSLDAMQDTSYSRLHITNLGAIRKISENKKRDVFWDHFRDLAPKLVSNHWSNYAITNQYNSLLNGEGTGRLTIFSILKETIFHGFRSVMIAGADFEESLIHYLFTKKHKVRFIQAKEYKKHLQYEKHQNGGLLTIYYAFDGIWSKNLRDKDNKDIQNKILSGVKKLLPEGNFIWSGNKDLDNDIFGSDLKNNRIPHTPHGLNRLSNTDNVVILSAYNPIPSFSKFICDYLNISNDQVTTAIQRQTIYQAIMRCSLRDPKNMNEKIVFVPDLASALWLQSKFEGSQVQFLDCGLNIEFKKRGRKRIHNSGAEKTKESRQRMKQSILALNDLLCPEYHYPLSDNQNLCIENTILLKNKVTTKRVFFFERIDDPLPYLYHDFATLVEMEEFLKLRHKTRFESKGQNKLMSLTLFDPSKSADNKRGIDNALHTNGILLDFDGGHLNPEDLARIFPDLRMTIYNTYSSTKENLKFRVYIPTTLLLDSETYGNITNHLLQRIMENGFYDKRKTEGSASLAHGLDTTKMHCASLFYLPCQPDNKSGKYFKTYKGAGRNELDVIQYIHSMDIKEDDEYEYVLEPWFYDEEFNHDDREDKIIDAASMRFRSSALTIGAGNQSFFSFACSLAAAGCDEYEIRKILTDEAHHARSPTERLREIPSMMKSLKKRGYIKPIYAVFDGHVDNGLRNA